MEQIIAALDVRLKDTEAAIDAKVGAIGERIEGSLLETKEDIYWRVNDIEKRLTNSASAAVDDAKPYIRAAFVMMGISIALGIANLVW